MNKIFEAYQGSIDEGKVSNSSTVKLSKDIASMILKDGDSSAAHALIKAVQYLHTSAKKHENAKPSLLEVENFMQVLQDYKGN